ncbi:MAG: LapA family protein [Thermoanaerobacteraceae bacterium]|nr:LapA family protein [Thermoanaerobacteraceae bacterium]
MKGQYYIILVLIFAILVSIFAISNAAPVNINFLYWHYTISQALVILLSAAIGALAIGIVGIFGQIRSSLRIKGLNNKIKTMEKENEELMKKMQELEQQVQHAANKEFKPMNGDVGKSNSVEE